MTRYHGACQNLFCPPVHICSLLEVNLGRLPYGFHVRIFYLPPSTLTERPLMIAELAVHGCEMVELLGHG